MKKTKKTGRVELGEIKTKKVKKLPATKTDFVLPNTIKQSKISIAMMSVFAKENLFEYGEYVVKDRAVPEFRDGLKPVHRHLIYAMHKLNLHGSDFKKSARVIGDTIGKYHPHGDCLSGNTRVLGCDGSVRKIKNLLGSDPIWVWSYNEEKQIIEPALAHSFRVGQVTKDIYHIELSNGDVVKATGNHPFMSVEGKWISTENLEVGQQLVGGQILRESYHKLSLNTHVSCNLHELSGAYLYDDKDTDEIYHHSDGDRENNRPDNIVVLDRSEHASHHGDYIEGLPTAGYLAVRSIKLVKSKKAIPMYDFTVKGNENMLIATGRNSQDNSLRVMLAHNSACYGALVTIANTFPKLAQGRGNWGSPIDNAAAQRYCFTADTLVSSELGLLPIGRIPEVLGKTPKRKLEISLKVESRDGVELATHWLDSGVREIFEVETRLGKIKGTSNEPLLTLDSNLDFSWKTIEDISEGDIVCYKRDPKIKWTKGSKLLNQPDIEGRSSSMKILGLPKKMSSEFATWLGLVISEGSITKHTVQFMNSDKDMVDLFVELTESLFENVHVSVTWREPDGINWAKRPYAQCTINSTHLISFLSANGIFPCVAREKEVPLCVLMSSKVEMVSFLSSLFEGDGSAHASGVTYTSKSSKLLDQLQTILVSKFGLPFAQTKDTLYLCSKLMHDRFQSEIGFLSERKSGNVLNSAYDNQKLSFLPEVVRSYYEDILSKQEDEEGNPIPKYIASMLYGLSGRSMPLTLESLKLWLTQVGKFVGKYFPTFVDKLTNILDKNYFLVPIKRIEYIGDEPTYDLTVPVSNSYTANGMIVHNTEVRLADYAKMFLLDSGYLEVVPRIKNFDDSEDIPLYLPSLLPTMLLIGNEGGIAYGVRACNPSFEIEGVAKLVEIALNKGKVTDEECVKHLRINAPFGSECVSTKEELEDFIKTGRAKAIKYRPKINIDYKNKIIEIVSYAPGFQSEEMVEKKRDKIRELPGVSRWVSDCGDKRPNAGAFGAYYYVVPKRGVDDDGLYDLAEKVKKILTGSQFYNLGLVVNHVDETKTKFAYVNFSNYITQWVKYRIVLEQKYLENVISKRERDIWEYETQMFAVINKDKVLEVMKKALDKDDPDTYAAKTLKIDRERATYIIERKLRSLAKLELNTIKDKLKTAQADIKGWKKDLKNPNPRISSSLSESVNKYIKLMNASIAETKKSAKKKKAKN
jgi:intein/homing endonuclease